MTSTATRSQTARLLAVLVAAPSLVLALTLPAGATSPVAPVLSSPTHASFSPGQPDAFQLAATGTPAPAISLGADAEAIAELDPLGWWDLSDTASSSTARDASGQGGAGTVAGGPVTFGQLGPPGNGPETAAAFGGTGYLNTSVFQPAVSAMTELAWFKTSSSSANQVIISTRDGNGTNDLQLAIGNPQSGSIFFGMDESGRQIAVASTDDSYDDGTWHLAVGVWSGSAGQPVTGPQFTLYVDGARVATTTSSISNNFTAPLLTNKDFQIGYNDAWTPFDGDLAQVAVIPSALNATQAQNLYQAATDAGSLPAGLSFAAGSGGTATLSGTPSATTSGSYTIPVVAANGVSPVATQQLDLGVGTAPEITSSGSTSCTVGSRCTFSFIASGAPTASWSEAGALPSDVTFTDNGDGTATLSGMVGTAAQWPITVTASDGIAPDAVQAFTLTATAAPTPNTATIDPAEPPLLSVASTGAPVSAGSALVELTCSSGPLCEGSATVSVARYPSGAHATHPAVARARISLDGAASADISFRLTAFGARRLGVARFRHGEPFAATLLVTTTSGQRLVERVRLRT